MSVKYLEPIFPVLKKKKFLKMPMALYYQVKVKILEYLLGNHYHLVYQFLTTYETPWKIINDYNAGYVFKFSNEEIEFYLGKILKFI